MMKMIFGIGLLFASGLLAQPADQLTPFFDDSRVHKINLRLAPSDWDTLRATAAENTYYKVSMEWDGRIVEDVAIRSRGNGSRNGIKPGLKVDFNRYNKNARFLGMKSFVLDNVVQDVSTVRERASMALFRRMGLAAPREAHCRLYVNGKYFGLYIMIEPMDENFLERGLGESAGTLYEFNWVQVYQFDYFGDDPSAYVPSLFEPKINPSPASERNLAEFIRMVNTADPDQFQANIGRYLDLERVALYLAVENYISEIDGLVGRDGMNNFYLYQSSKTGQFLFLAWDKDVSFADYGHPVDYNLADTNRLFARLWAIPEFRDLYYRQLLRVTDSAGGRDGWFHEIVSRAMEQIKEPYLEDDFFLCKPTSDSACGEELFEMAADYVKEFAAQRRAIIFFQLALEESADARSAISRK
jgi:hypothetical protein